MASCDVNALLQTGRDFQAASPYQLKILTVTLLSQILQASNPMAACDVDSLLRAGACFQCADSRALDIISVQLLCEILQGGGVGGTCLTSGVGPPVSLPTCVLSIYRDETAPGNSGVWLGDSTTGQWEEIIASGP